MNRLHRWYCRSDHWRRTVEHDLLEWTLDGATLGGATLGDHLLELGAGQGTATTHLATRVPRLTAIDIEAAALADMRRHHMPGAHAVSASAVTLPFADSTFSSAATFMMLHHVEDRGRQRAVLLEVLRVLRPGGVFAGCETLPTMGMHLFHLGDVFQPVTPDALDTALHGAGFDDVHVATTGRYLRWSARRPRSATWPTMVPASRAPRR